MSEALTETVTLNQAKQLIKCLAAHESLLLLSSPGVGKSETIRQAAAEAGLPCRSLLGTQLAPEDISGIPRIVGERSVFCPPRVLLPESNEPFCLFLDELPACTPDVQKAFYSLLLERRIGEYHLPEGTWVVAAGNRVEDRALVRTLSAALVNRVTVLHVQVDASEWLDWAEKNGVHPLVRSFIEQSPRSLMRPIADPGKPFSTPRSWTMLSQALSKLYPGPQTDRKDFDVQLTVTRALTAGRLSDEDVMDFSNWWLVHLFQRSEDNTLGYHRRLVSALDRLGISQKAVDALQRCNVTRIKELVTNRRDYYEKTAFLDEARLYEIESALHDHGLWFGMEF